MNLKQGRRGFGNRVQEPPQTTRRAKLNEISVSQPLRSRHRLAVDERRAVGKGNQLVVAAMPHHECVATVNIGQQRHGDTATARVADDRLFRRDDEQFVVD